MQVCVCGPPFDTNPNKSLRHALGGRSMPDPDVAAVVEGVKIDPATDVRALVRGQLLNWSVWVGKEDVTPVDGLTRALRNAGPVRQRLAEALLVILIDSDLGVRSGAVAILGEVTADLGVERIAHLLRAHLPLFENVPSRHPGFTWPDLAWGIRAAMAREVRPGDTMAFQELRSAVRDPKLAIWVVSGLARADADWLLDQAKKIVSRNVVGLAIFHLPDLDHREKLLLALAPWTSRECESLQAHPLWRKLPAEHRARLKGLLEERSR